MNVSTRKARLPARTAVLGLALTSCFTASTVQWMRDEVTYLGTSTGSEHTHFVSFSVKNLEGVSEDLVVLEIAIPADWRDQPRDREPDGGLCLKEPLPDSCCRFTAQDPVGDGVALRLDRRSALGPSPAADLPRSSGPSDPRYGYELHRRGGAWRVTLYGELAEEGRWVRLGTFPVARGRQSWIRKPLGLLALPVSAALDVVTLAFLVVLVDGSMFYL